MSIFSWIKLRPLVSSFCILARPWQQTSVALKASRIDAWPFSRCKPERVSQPSQCCENQYIVLSQFIAIKLRSISSFRILRSRLVYKKTLMHFSFTGNWFEPSENVIKDLKIELFDLFEQSGKVQAQRSYRNLLVRRVILTFTLQIKR